LRPGGLNYVLLTTPLWRGGPTDSASVAAVADREDLDLAVPILGAMVGGL